MNCGLIKSKVGKNTENKLNQSFASYTVDPENANCNCKLNLFVNKYNIWLRNLKETNDPLLNINIFIFKLKIILEMK